MYSSSIVGNLIVLGFTCFLLACNHTNVVGNSVCVFMFHVLYLACIYIPFRDCKQLFAFDWVLADCDVAVTIHFTF